MYFKVLVAAKELEKTKTSNTMYIEVEKSLKMAMEKFKVRLDTVQIYRVSYGRQRIVNVEPVFRLRPCVPSKGGAILSDFRYKKIPKCCYTCGIFGHDEDDCVDAEKLKEVNGEAEEVKLGPWLKARYVGKKME
ncbi:cysteine desulfurase mitochondrial-like [Senna tora]|uniref:Cysteine desulfurase mitochondrial-like n=1 Tax=Senna tora TaxID=362788 RepID=A0A834TMG8_9FABA|nr:cysteine desulfurase mitochondrial-like [Senna tora]